MIKWINQNKNAVIRNTFLLPILLVVIMSISHVVSWYDLGNPISWAIYLSVAIEIFALSSVSAATIKINRTAIWFLFGLVTFIQIIGNIFFEYKEIDITSPDFKSWVELITPFFIDWDLTDHRRLLAIIQGGTLPIMSLTALHYYIKFKDQEVDQIVEESLEVEDEEEPEDQEHPIEEVKKAEEDITESNSEEFKEAINIWGQTRGSIEGVSDEDIMKNYKDYIQRRDEKILKNPSKKPGGVNPKLNRAKK